VERICVPKFQLSYLGSFSFVSGEDHGVPTVIENDFVLAAVVDAVYQFPMENRRCSVRSNGPTFAHAIVSTGEIVDAFCVNVEKGSF
jgi:hypothetical protein